MKLFVTGGTGFVGSHFINAALAAGHDVVALRRQGSTPRIVLDAQPEWIDGALDGNYLDALKECEAVIHLASHTPNPPYAALEDCLYWNVFAAIKLCRQAAKVGVSKYLIAGSCFEYGIAAASRQKISTDTPLQPNLSYPTSKAAASVAFEGFAREHGVYLKLLRIFQVFGEGEQATRLWPSLRTAALAGRDFPMSLGEQVRDFVQVEEVAAQFLRHLDFSGVTAGTPRVHHIASGKAQSLRDFAQYWWDHWQATGQLQFGAVPYRNNELMHLIPELSAD